MRTPIGLVTTTVDDSVSPTDITGRKRPRNAIAAALPTMAITGILHRPVGRRPSGKITVSRNRRAYARKPTTLDTTSRAPIVQSKPPANNAELEIGGSDVSGNVHAKAISSGP